VSGGPVPFTVGVAVRRPLVGLRAGLRNQPRAEDGHQGPAGRGGRRWRGWQRQRAL